MKPGQVNTPNNEKFGDRMKRFILSILTLKSKVQENSKQKCKGLPFMTRSQGPVRGKLFMLQQVVERQDLMTSVGQTVKGKLGVHYSCVSTNPVSRPISYYESKKKKKTRNISTVHHANLKVQSQPSLDKGMSYGRPGHPETLSPKPAPIHTDPMFHMSNGSLSAVQGTVSA